MVRRGTPGNPADAGALVVEEFAYSHAQRAYQAEVGNRAPELIPRKPKPGEPAPTPGERGVRSFIRAATPKADHFMQFAWCGCPWRPPAGHRVEIRRRCPGSDFVLRAEPRHG